MKYILLIIISVIASCKSNQDYLIDVNESLIKTAASFKRNAQFQTLDFEEKARDPITEVKAKSYLPAIRQINNQTKELEAILDSMISNPYDPSKKNTAILFNKISEYKKEVFKADDRIEKPFQNDFVVIGKQADSLLKDEEELFKTLSAKRNVTERNVFLNGIKSNVWYNTSNVLNFLRTTVTYHMPHYYPGPVVCCNTTVIQSGDSIKIVAGIGHFDWNTPYSVELDGKTLKKTDNGVIEYYFVPKNKIGSHKLPVKFKYVDQDGREMTFDTKIEYKIVN